MDKALTSFNNLVLRSQIRDDDGVDQLHHFVTVAMLAAFAAITGVIEYAGEPINCWNYGDNYFKHYMDHVNQYCWTHSLYHYPDRVNLSVMPFQLRADGSPVDSDIELNSKLPKITFYRWVTIIFLIQGFLFKVPNLLWNEYNTYSGSNLVKMVELMQDIMFIKEEDRKDKIRQVALFLEQWLRIQRKRHWFLRPEISPMVRKTLSWCTLCIGDNMSRNLTNVYLLTKLTFLLNTVSQFFILSAWLQINFWKFGTQTLRNYAKTTPVPSTDKTFPLVALCHFQTIDQVKDNPPGYKGRWVQCILTINMFLEKLFLLEWFWLLVLIVLTFGSFAHWCFKIMRTNTTIQFVRRYMKLMGYYNPLLEVPSYCSEAQFVTEYLLNDGVFVLRILAVNTNEVVVAQLVEELWKRYLDFARKSVENVDKRPDARPNSSFIRKLLRGESGERVLPAPRKTQLERTFS